MRGALAGRLAAGALALVLGAGAGGCAALSDAFATHAEGGSPEDAAPDPAADAGADATADATPDTEGERAAADLRRELRVVHGADDTADIPLAPPARQPDPVPRTVWLEVERPSADPVPTVRTAWAEVAGYAGTRGSGRFDVVIAIDVSGSTRWASGVDVNGNGVVGTRVRRIPPWKVFEPSFYCSDPGDTVLDAERLATRRLIERLDPRRTRIGIVSFSDLARPRGPLGSSRELLALVLDDLAGAFGAGPTNLAQATRLAIRMLTETGEDRSTAPEPVLLILSDGYPTHPESEEHAAAEALAAAKSAGLAGIRISSFALGIGEPNDPDVFAQMAQVTGGEHVRVAQPGDVVEVLPAIDLAKVAGIEIENATTQDRARALRVRPDGTWDAYVRLRPGENRLRVTARGEAGDTTSAERLVIYDDREPNPEEAERMRKKIELRTVEIQLEREAREGKAQQRVIQVEPVPEASGGETP